MRDTTPFASFLPLNGFIMVLRNETSEADGDLFPNNLVNKPMFIVNGGRDPLYPTSIVDPYIEHLKKGGVDLVYRAAAERGARHLVVARRQGGVRAVRHRAPAAAAARHAELGKRTVELPSRAHWLVIDRLGAERARRTGAAGREQHVHASVADFGHPRQRNAHQSRGQGIERGTDRPAERRCGRADQQSTGRAGH